MTGQRPARAPACEICDGTGWAFYEDAKQVRRVAACLCVLGRRKVDGGLMGIERVLSEAEMATRFGPAALQMIADTLPSRLQAAGVPPDWTGRSLASFTERFAGDALLKKYAGAYAHLWLSADRPSDLVLYGPNGTGKSGLATALLRAVIERRQPSRWVSVPTLMVQWRACFNNGPSEAGLLDGLRAPDLLVLDEITGTRASEFVETTITLIVDERQRLGRATILTLNTPDLPEADDGPYLTTLLGPTLMDRLRERGQFWPLRGRSKRRVWKPPAAAQKEWAP
jgi:DNA replication protein DnaC